MYPPPPPSPKQTVYGIRLVTLSGGLRQTARDIGGPADKPKLKLVGLNQRKDGRPNVPLVVAFQNKRTPATIYE